MLVAWKLKLQNEGVKLVSGRHLIKNDMAAQILSILYDCLLHKYEILGFKIC
jgi:hypothetical protein